MKYFNDKLGEYIPISPKSENGFQQYVDQIDLRGSNDIWRILFKDKKSKELSDMADQRGMLQFQIRIDVDGQLKREDLGSNFFLEIDDAKV